MNERILELREQAWALVSDEEQARGELYKTRVRWERCDQKFAELIVAECASKVDWILAEGGKTQGDLIKQHFGVES